MNLLILLSVVVAIAVAIPVEIAEDEEGQQYYVLPVSREKRQAQTKWGVSETGFGVSHKGTILNNDNHRLDGSAYAGKNFRSHGLKPDQLGGRLDYSHKPSSTSAFISADHTRHFGTDVRAGLNHNLHHRKNFDLDVTGQYGQHFGGPFGNSKPQGYVGIVGRATF